MAQIPADVASAGWNPGQIKSRPEGCLFLYQKGSLISPAFSLITCSGARKAAGSTCFGFNATSPTTLETVRPCPISGRVALESTPSTAYITAGESCYGERGVSDPGYASR